MDRKTTIFGISVLLIFLIGFYSNALGATLSWTASTGEVTGYNLYYSESEGSYSLHVDVGNVISYSTDFLSLTVGTPYYFVVTAYNFAGESGYSNMVSLTPADTTPPIPPEELEATEVLE
ncbi:MAG: fibronectin type III domain-containing protein [Desulfobacteraceae bacterium]|nr:fibronectin type III domain-containing protein [Desulfobacteraceae bacterium]MBC2720716.1 fibronectin type III domain-containing protein [Desulfobacteraceae bacterium]